MASRDQGLGAGIKVEGLDSTLRAFRDLPAQATKELQSAAEAASAILVGQVQAAGHARGGAAALLAGTVRVRKGQAPGVEVGGTMALGRHHTPANELLYGSEFGHGGQGGRGKGSRDYAPHGFSPRAAPQGLWIFPTLRRIEHATAVPFHEAAQRIADEFIHDAAAWGS